MRVNAAVVTALSLVLGATGTHAQSVVRSYPQQQQQSLRAPDVNVWIDRFSYRPGQRLRAFFQSDPGAYVTILRVTTTGEVRVLYPRRPSLQQAYQVNRLVDDEVPYSNDLPFFLNEPEGVGFVFAIASYQPFDYRNVSSRDMWSTYSLAGIGYDDPLELASRFIERTLGNDAEPSMDYIQYQVLQNLYYPRRIASYTYDDIYLSCLRYYYGIPQYYCSQYARFGNPFYTFGDIARRGAPPPAQPAVGYKRPRLPQSMKPHPVPIDQGLEKGTPAPQRGAEFAASQKAWWDAQRREASGKRINTAERVPIGDPQTGLPQVYRSTPSAPRIGTESGAKYEPRNDPYQGRRSEPMMGGSKYDIPQQRRSEPMTQSPPVVRSAPPPQATQAAPARPPQVIRMEPSVRPAPPTSSSGEKKDQ